MKTPPAYDSIIAAKGIGKRFGYKTVLRHVDLLLKQGDSLALFGPNGAGKTTLIQILCSLMQPTSGHVKIAGYDTRYERQNLCKVVGVVAHHTFLYDNLSACENLKFYGTMYGVINLKKKIEKLIREVGLGEYRNERVHTFSRGMQQRLSVARAIIHDPLILFLDEPYTGLDPQGAEDFKQILQDFRKQGKTILMTSHDLNKGLELCNRVAILASGRLVYDEDLSKLTADNFKQTYHMLTARTSQPAMVSR